MFHAGLGSRCCHGTATGFERTCNRARSAIGTDTACGVVGRRSQVDDLLVESRDGIVFTYVTGRWSVDDSPSAALISLDGSGFEVLAQALPATHPRLRPG